MGFAKQGSSVASYVDSIHARVEADNIAVITITYGTLYDDWGYLKFKKADAGSKLIMEGECTNGQIKWHINGTLPDELMKRLYAWYN